MKPIVTIDRDTYIYNIPGAAVRLLIIITICGMMAMTSCHSHRHVVRGDQGIEAGHEARHSGHSGPTSDKPPHTGDKSVDALLAEAYKWMGTPYLYGGKTRKGADCSGFVMVVFDDALNIKLPRVSRDQAEYCKEIKKSDLRPGDLVFFWTGKEKHRITHVGIYVGDSNMIHASSSKGVCVSSIDSQYFSVHYERGGRVEALDALRRKKR